MIQFLLMLIGFIYPNHNMDKTPTELTVQSNNDLSEDLDTGGETGTTLPPKK